MEEIFDKIRIKDGERPLVFILSGAGLSAESGIPTFRGPEGLWKTKFPAEIASVETLQNNPQELLDFYNFRIESASGKEPNAAHLAIAKFQNEMASICDVIHVTQNVDNLNELAGAPRVFHLHGEFATSVCRQCESVFPRLGNYHKDLRCPACGATEYSVRPNIVLFGEMPHGMDWIPGYLKKACVFLAIGTSGRVYPAADFVRTTKASLKINFDIDPSIEMVRKFNHKIYGECTKTLPPFLDQLKEALCSKSNLPNPS